MNPNINDQAPQNLQNTSPEQAIPTEPSSGRKIIQPISENLVIDSDPREQQKDTKDSSVVQPAKTPVATPSGPAPRYPQYGAVHQSYGPPAPQTTPEENTDGGLISVAITIIGVLYIVSGALSILSGFFAILTLNPLSVIVPWAFGLLYIYIGKGLIRRDSTARIIALVLSWLLLIGVCIGTAATASLLLPSLSRGVDAFQLIIFAPLVVALITELIIIVVLSNKQARRAFS